MKQPDLEMILSKAIGVFVTWSVKLKVHGAPKDDYLKPRTN